MKVRYSYRVEASIVAEIEPEMGFLGVPLGREWFQQSLCVEQTRQVIFENGLDDIWCEESLPDDSYHIGRGICSRSPRSSIVAYFPPSRRALQRKPRASDLIMTASRRSARNRVGAWSDVMTSFLPPRRLSLNGKLMALETSEGWFTPMRQSPDLRGLHPRAPAYPAIR